MVACCFLLPVGRSAVLRYEFPVSPFFSRSWYFILLLVLLFICYEKLRDYEPLVYDKRALAIFLVLLQHINLTLVEYLFQPYQIASSSPFSPPPFELLRKLVGRSCILKMLENEGLEAILLWCWLAYIYLYLYLYIILCERQL